MAHPVQVQVDGALMRAQVGKVLVGFVAPATLVRLDPLVPVLVVQHLLLVHEALQIGPVDLLIASTLMRSVAYLSLADLDLQQLYADTVRYSAKNKLENNITFYRDGIAHR